MAFDVVKPERFDFDSSTGPDRGKAQGRTVHIDVGPNAKHAHAFINGFKIGFIDDDEQLGQMEINIEVKDVENNKAEVELVFALRDKSGFNNAYKGFIDVGLIVERR